MVFSVFVTYKLDKVQEKFFNKSEIIREISEKVNFWSFFLLETFT